MEILLIILSLYSVFTTGILFFIIKRATEKKYDLELFIKSLYGDLINFKQSVENITKYNILVYDESVFEIMNLFKDLKNKIDNYMLKYDEYSNYVYSEDVVEEQKQSLGLIRTGANNEPTIR